ncbi:UbiA family prenyltransferase [Methanotorris igneus]|uniref:Digeranylgeranylglyceryl phosphate synthase n=1 Tax=Methanotorris igneus (strain DSM 5666 / JCM 11834 / Kol 5) TaxID=880724 RepID=F6BDJ7_METIK|nr:UbiA family prenyltransferase [Methanotorris igneus]AEF96558.1 Digeranylgeranylglyceryl phosphate synthase [Methanotorris igneus Kol 5]
MMKYYLELMRVKNCITASFGAFIGGLIASNFNFGYLFVLILAFLVVFFICGFGNVVNDIYDVEIDKLNKPHRPLPSNKISIKNAWRFAWLLLIFGLVLSFFNVLCFIIALINSVMLYLYAKKYKRNKIIGNFIVAYLTGSVFLFGGVAVNNMPIVTILFLCAMFATWCREIIKDFEDIDGDMKEGVVSLPIKYGKKSLYIAAMFIIVAVALSPLPYIMGIFGEIYLILIILCDLSFLYVIFKAIKNPSKNIMSKTSKYLKIIMNLVLMCFVLGALM